MYHTKPSSRQGGLTLIEVLVSMLVMAMGLLGIAALQTTTLKYQQGSSQRTIVGGLLGDYVERVRANLGQAPGVPTANTSAYLLSGNWAALSAAQVDAPAVDCAASGVTCSPTDLATYDMQTWRQSVREALPMGSVNVRGTASTGLSVTLMWADKEFSQSNGASTQSRQSATCNASTVTGAAAEFCCPASVAAPAGVRCARFTVMP